MGLKDAYQDLIVRIATCRESETDQPMDRMIERATVMAPGVYDCDPMEALDYVEDDIQEELDKRVRPIWPTSGCAGIRRRSQRSRRRSLQSHPGT